MISPDRARISARARHSNNDMFDSLASIFSFLIKAFLALSTLIWLIRYRQLPDALRVLGYFLAIDLAIEFSAGYLASKRMNNLPLLHLFTFCEFIFFSFFFYHLIRTLSRHKRQFFIFLSVIAAFLVVNSAFIQTIYSFNSIAKGIVHLILIIYAIWYFYQLSSLGPDEASTTGRPLRLINSAVLLYYSGSLFIFMFTNFIQANDLRMHRGFWAFNAGLNVVFQLLVLIGLWLTAFRQTKSSSSWQ